jgi:uncharacterized protein YfaS (alpha-2-macroglobulin family)
MRRVRGRIPCGGPWLVLLLLMLGAWPARAQTPPDEDRQEFSLASRQIFSTKDNAAIDLDFQAIDHLDFRVYRVQDPRAFFAKLKDAHQFGSPEPVVPQEQTWLERIAAWKAEQRADLRDTIRRMMSPAYRAERRKRLDQAVVSTRRTVQYSTFAQVPLLNAAQVVSSWREILPRVRGGEHRRLPLELPGPGVYLVEAVSPPHRAYTIVMVSDIGLVTKAAPGQALLFAANRFSGVPLANCQTHMLLDRQAVFDGPTSGDGVAEATFDNHKPDAVVALAQCGNDTVVTDPGSYSLHGDARSLVGYIYTDKPIYRPGHTVRLKGVLRWRAHDAIVPFDQPQAEVSIADPDDKVLLRQTLKVDAFGAINTTFAVPAFAALGNYTIRLTSGDQNATGTFEVQEYRKPEFEVTVTSPDHFVRQGGKIKATIKARYYFGQPVARGAVTYTLHKSGYYSPLRWSDDQEGEQEYVSDFAGDQISEQKVRLNDQGEATVAIDLPVDDNSRDYTLRVEARVTDPSGREVSGHGNVIGTFGDFMLSASPDRYMYAPGTAATVNVRAMDYKGEARANVPVTVLLERRKYTSGYGSEPEITVITKTTLQTDAGGRAALQATLPKDSGSYTFHATAPSGDRTVEDTASAWVPGAEERTEDEGEQYLELVADQKTYAPGQTARLLVRGADGDATMLVTKEAQTIAWYQVMRVRAGQPVEVPITEADIGDTWINIAFIKNDRLYRAEKRVRVPETSRGINISITTDQKVAKPREPGVFTIQTTDPNGAPVRAQVSLSVVDEAVYAVKTDDTPDPVRFFYRREYSRVGTSFSREYAFVGYSGAQALELAKRATGRRPFTLADFKSGQAERPHVRKEFPDAIFWAADLTTDASGTATVRVSYPDALTTWRLTARAVTADTRAGAALNRTTTTKDVILRVITPRFLTEGDTMRLPTVTHNYLADAKSMTVSVEAKGLTPLDASATAPKTATIASGDESRMEWPFKADRVGSATVTGTATTEGDGDAVEQTLPVLPYGLKRETGQAGSIASGERTLDLTIPDKSNPAARTIEVSLAPSLAGALFSALDFLADYPYGCTEQTVSSFFPNLMVLRALNDLKIAPTERLRVLDRMTSDGLKRLYDLQHDDGGWGWWPADQDHPFMTAYAVGALLEAQRANLKVDVYRLQKGVGAAAKLYAKYPRAVPELKAYMAYTLSQAIAQGVKPESGDDGSGGAGAGAGAGAAFDGKAAVEELWAKRGSLTAYGKALLLLTLDVTKDARGDGLAKELAGGAQTRGDLSWWTSDNDPLLDDWEDTSVEATAMAVKALAPHMATDPLIERAARWLLVNRSGGYYWASTKQTAFALMGLLEHLRARHETPATTVVDVEINGAKVGSHTFTPESWTQANPITLTAPGQPGANHVRLVVRSGGAVYWTATARYYDNRDALEQTGTHRLALSRAYYTLSPKTLPNGKIVYHEEPFTGNARPGDLLLVRLVAAGSKEWRYLLLEDPLPAGVEAVRDPDIYTLEHRPTWWYGSKREYRDTRIVQFQNEFSEGRYEYTYLLKVVTPGSFRAMPAQIAPMYVPDVFATTGVQTLEVMPAPTDTAPAGQAPAAAAPAPAAQAPAGQAAAGQAAVGQPVGKGGAQ